MINTSDVGERIIKIDKKKDKKNSTFSQYLKDKYQEIFTLKTKLGMNNNDESPHKLNHI